MSDFIIIILTIKRNIVRLNKLEEILQHQSLKRNENYRIFYGIDYKNTDRKVLQKLSRKCVRKICPYSVLACASSHILLWKYISTLYNDFIIVLEDDTFINIDIFNKNINIIKQLINDSLIFLFSDCFIMGNKKKMNSFLITDSPKFHVSMGCYILTPKTASILYYYYIRNKVWFHIDFQLNFDLLNLNIKRYIISDKNLCNQYEGYKSSMGIKHNNFLSYTCKDTTFYRIITTPIIRFGNIEVDFYTLICFIFIMIIILNYELNIYYIIIVFFLLLDIFLSA